MTKVYYTYNKTDTNIIRFMPEFAYDESNKIGSMYSVETDAIEYYERKGMHDLAQKWTKILNFFDKTGLQSCDDIDACNIWYLPKNITENQLIEIAKTNDYEFIKCE